MPGKSSIEWTSYTWNPVTGCHKVSEGCRHCYAEALSNRFGRTSQPWTFPHAAENVVLHPERLGEPLKWRTPHRVFVNSVSDLFHENVPDGFIWAVWEVMAKTPWHTYQILTKRPERMRDFVSRWSDLQGESPEPQLVRRPAETRARHPSGRGQLFAAWLDYLALPTNGEPPPGAAWPTFDWMEGPRWWPTQPLSNVWLGVTCEQQRWADQRIPLLLQTPAAVRFVSVEPQLESIDLTHLDRRHGYGHAWSNALNGTRFQISPGGSVYRPLPSKLSWVICGGESGPGHRPFDLDWARSLRDACQAAGVPYFFKQAGGTRPGTDRLLDGREWSEFPEVAHV